MNDKLYEDLRKQIDAYSLGFPATESGIEIKILKYLFTEADAELFLKMTPMLEAPESVAGRIGLPIEEVEPHLEDMAQRGLLFRLRKGDSAKYGAIPFMHGLLEFKINDLTPEIVDMFEQYYDEKFHEAVSENAGMFLRTVPVQQSIEPEYHVSAFEDACDILRNADIIAVADCICRKERGMIGKACDKPLETCFMFGSMARYYIENNIGRQLTVDEAIDILTRAQDAGLVTQPSTSRNPNGMCSCCGDCCGILRSIKMHPKPAELVFSNYSAALDPELCSGCEACIDRCQMEALQMNSSGIAEIDHDRCIGCGLCVTTCPTGALSLVARPEEKRSKLPVNASEQMITMAKNRGVL